MLRTQDIATRVVNGFLPGEYTKPPVPTPLGKVTPIHGLSLFPETKTWVTFDPTPAAGRTEPKCRPRGPIGKYAEALELIWFQYVVGYDKQEHGLSPPRCITAS